MNRKLLIAFLLGTIGFLSACNSGYTRRNPGKTYVPDMTYSQAYDAYTENPNTKDSLTSQLPVKGTIARGQALPDHLTSADTSAYRAMKNPYTFSEEELAHGKRLYNIQCGICHGTDLDGNGPLYASGKFAAMPANLNADNIKNLSDGSYYHTIMYGKGMMGSYASQLDHKQRWQVIAYIRSKTGGAPVAASSNNDSTVASK